jgi:hypothetical protein
LKKRIWSEPTWRLLFFTIHAETGAGDAITSSLALISTGFSILISRTIGGTGALAISAKKQTNKQINKQNKTKTKTQQNKQNKTKQNKTKQNKTKQNKTNKIFHDRLCDNTRMIEPAILPSTIRSVSAITCRSASSAPPSALHFSLRS